MTSSQKTIVISGINFFQGGPLTVMTTALETLSKHFSDYRIIALVNSKKLYKVSNIEFIEFPKSRKSWFFRLYYEYFFFNRLSKKIKPDFWLSMHDITPNVNCSNRYVYCHNPSPFFEPTYTDFKYGFTTYLFSKFYKYLYRINIHKNKFIIVQQDWLRESFKRKFNVHNIIVAHPEIEKPQLIPNRNLERQDQYVLFYPSLPRPFKNFELICNAYKRLPIEYQNRLQIYLTIDDTLNKYSKKIISKFGNIPGLHFTGLLSREKVFKYYEKADGLIFPSRLETWGLPISEFKNYNKPIFLADLPYAHETLGNYKKAKFFDPYSAEELNVILKNYIDGSLTFDRTIEKKVLKPYVKGWNALFNRLFND